MKKSNARFYFGEIAVEAAGLTGSRSAGKKPEQNESPERDLRVEALDWCR